MDFWPRSIIEQDKGRWSQATPPGHKAPQCGAFLSFTGVVGKNGCPGFRCTLGLKTPVAQGLWLCHGQKEDNIGKY